MAKNSVAKIGSRPARQDDETLPTTTTVRGSVVSRARYAEFLPDLEAIAEREHSPYARLLAIVCAAFFAAIIGWAAIGQVEQTVTAPGDVRPAGKVKIINHPDGGIVAALYVHEGERVKEGDRLVELDTRSIDQETARLANEWQSLSAEVARLEAEIGGKALAFPPGLAAARPDLVHEQTHQYDEDKRAREARRSAADEKVAQARSTYASTEKEVQQLEDGVRVSLEQERVLGELTDKGYFPKLRYLSVKRQLSDDQGQLARAREDLKRTRAVIGEAEGERDQADAEFTARLIDRLVQARLDRDRAYRGMKQQEARRASLLITAPVPGIVQNLVVASPGQSVRPSEPIMNIVPSSDTLVVEAHVPNNEIGHVSLGQHAIVKVDTYPAVRYGTLEGTVESIAPDASRNDKTGQTYFNVYIRTDKTYLGRTPEELPVNPGMQTNVVFHIGKHSILAYLTDRFRQKAANAFTEF
jgi:adhesin transport system membrane fusion protein